MYFYSTAAILIQKLSVCEGSDTLFPVRAFAGEIQWKHEGMNQK